MIRQKLKLNEEEKYRIFQSRLIKSRYPIFGVRLPTVKKLVKEHLQSNTKFEFFLPESFEEAMALGFLIAGSKLELGEKLPLVEKFLPYIDNWAVCDSFCMALNFKPKQLAEVWAYFKHLQYAEGEFERRFFIVLTMSYFLKDEYIDEVFRILKTIKNGEYYVDMAVSWALADAILRYPQKTLDILAEKTLPKFIQNKAIQKMRESYRVPQEIKEKLLFYKI